MQWFYASDDKPLPLDGGEERPCTHCGLECVDGEPDPCFGKLPGVKYACCGHGFANDAYIYFESGVVIRGFNRIEVRRPEEDED